MKNKPIYCGLAHSAVSLKSDGEYMPCCNIRTAHWESYRHSKDFNQSLPIENRLNTYQMVKVREELMSGNWPLCCYNCKEAEEQNVPSMRTIHNMTFKEPMDKTLLPTHVKYLDVTIDTICNSKCMTCGSASSSFWAKEEEFIWGCTDNPSQSPADRISLTTEIAKELVDKFINLECISIIGGEPTVSEQHFKFLEMLIEKDLAKNINLSYVTNLTGITETLLSYWEKFKSVGLSVSIDGVGKVNEYIRYPFKWDKTEKTLSDCIKLVKLNPGKYSIALSCTVSAYNCIQAIDLIEWWGELSEREGVRIDCFLNKVSSPEYTMVNVLSEEYRQEGVRKAEEFIKNNPDSSLSAYAKQIKNWCLEPRNTDPKLIEDLNRLTRQSDIFRKRHIKDFIPELDIEIKKLYNTKNNLIASN